MPEKCCKLWKNVNYGRVKVEFYCNVSLENNLSEILELCNFLQVIFQHGSNVVQCMYQTEETMLNSHHAEVQYHQAYECFYIFGIWKYSFPGRMFVNNISSL